MVAVGNKLSIKGRCYSNFYPEPRDCCRLRIIPLW